MSEERNVERGSGDELEQSAENVLEGWPAPVLGDPPADPPRRPIDDTVLVSTDDPGGWSAPRDQEPTSGTADREDGVPDAVLADGEPVSASDDVATQAEPGGFGVPAAPRVPGEVEDPSPPVVTERLGVESAGAEESSVELPAAAEEPAVDLPAVEEEAAAPSRPHGPTEHAPGELDVPPGIPVLEGEPRGERRAVGIVVSRFNGEVTSRLLERALAELEALGVASTSITVMPVPGAFELPLAAMALAKTRRFACVVALGCVIRGDTPHFDYVASEAASGLQLAAIETGVPVAFGVLTLDRHDQAEGRYDKGAEAVRTALEMADLFANLRAAASR